MSGIRGPLRTNAVPEEEEDRVPRGSDISIAGAGLLADPDGALYWPEEKLLVVADLHLEKGSSFARRGVLLPPYDTASTLLRLGALIARYLPRTVVALGDNFHDGEGARRMSKTDRGMLAAMQRGRDWIWIAGNHDPDPAAGIGGQFAESIAVGPLTLRHAPSRGHAEGEIAGHLHPVARVARRGRAVSRRCFAADGKRLIVPAFGAFTGGLNIRDSAFAGLFDPASLAAHMLGERRLFTIMAARCLPD